MFEIEQSFDWLVAFYWQKGKQENFISLANMRTSVVNAMNAANKRTKDARNNGVNMVWVVGKKVLGLNMERNPHHCHACQRLGHIAAN